MHRPDVDLRQVTPAPERAGFASVLDGVAGCFAMAAGVVTAAVVARALPGDEVADVQFVAWLVPAAAAVATWGLPNALAWAVGELRAEDPATARAVYARTMRLAGIGAAALAALFGLAVWQMVPEGRKGAYGFVTLWAFPAAWGAAQGGTLLGLGAHRTLLRLNGMGGLLDMAAVVTAASSAPTLDAIVGALAASAWARFIAQTVVVHLRMRALASGPSSPAPWRSDEMVEVYRFCRDIALLLVTDLVVWQRLEIAFVNARPLRHDVARYGMAWELAAVPWRLTAFFMGVYLPTAVFVSAADVGVAAAAAYRKATRYLATALVPVCAAAFVWRRPLCAALFGPSYEDAAEPAGWLIVTGGLGATLLAGSALRAGAGQGAALLQWGAFTALLKLVLAFLFVPSDGVVGATWSCALGQLAAGAVAVAYLRRSLGAWPDLDGLARASLASAVAIATAWGVARSAPGWAAAAAGCVVFGAAAAGFGCIPPEDRERLPGFLKKSFLPDRWTRRGTDA